MFINPSTINNIIYFKTSMCGTGRPNVKIAEAKQEQISGNHINSECFPVAHEECHEARFKSLEEARKAALEVAKEEDATPETRSKNEEQVDSARTFVGVWGNTASSRAPVTGMISIGYSERPGDVQVTVMNNWSDDP